MSDVWPKSLSEEARKWDNEALDLPPVGTCCRLVLEEQPEVPAEHLERNGRVVEIIAHICNGNLAVCICHEHWARSDVGEWWVAAFNSAAFEPLTSGDYEGAGGQARTPSKYHREIKPGVHVDVYDVLAAWGVQNPALQHLIKKALQPGERGHKTLEQDMADIVASAKRAQELEQ